MALKDRLNEGRLSAQHSDRGSVAHWRKRLLSEINLDDLAMLSMEQRRIRLEKVVGHLLSREGPVLSDRERANMIRRVVDEALGLGVLEPLLADESITEIMVNGPDNIFIERNGRVQRIETTFASEEQLYQTIDRIVSTVNRRVDESSPMVDARLPTGERVNVIIPPLSLSGPIVTIRRFPKPFTIEQLISMGSLDEATGILLASMIRARFNVIISGVPAPEKPRSSTHSPRSCPPTNASSPSKTPRNSSSSRSTCCAWKHVPPTSKAKEPSPSATSSATRCVCDRTASSSARSAARKPSTCCRR